MNVEINFGYHGKVTSIDNLLIFIDCMSFNLSQIFGILTQSVLLSTYSIQGISNIRMESHQIDKGRRRVSSRVIRCLRKDSSIRYLIKRKKTIPKEIHRRKTGHYRHAVRTVTSPELIDLYQKKQHRLTVTFLDNIELIMKSTDPSSVVIHLCFKDCRMISASGGIYLRARIELLKTKYPGFKYSITPPNMTRNRSENSYTSKPVVQSVLSQIGLYSLLGVNQPKFAQLANVDCWHVHSGSLVDSEALASAIEKVGLKRKDNAAIFRSTIEAMANAAEHAYTYKVKRLRPFHLTKWWLFTAIINETFFIYFCDLGHGIPVTLKHTQDVDFINAIYKKIDKLATDKKVNWLKDDVYNIKASTIVKETRTEQANRGKGIHDVRSLVTKSENSKLVIHSNAGSYYYFNKPEPLLKRVARVPGKFGPSESGRNNKHSICGTIIGWSIPLASERNQDYHE